MPLLALLTLALVPAVAQAQVLRNMDLKSHWDEYFVQASGGNEYSSCWGYVHGDGREYALLGTAQGTAIYNVTDPVNSYKVGFIPGVTSTWRNIKSYRNWVYVVSEGPGAGEGLQVISMADPENPVLTTTLTTSFSLAHTMHVDTTRALLFANGTRLYSGSPGVYSDIGMRILSLADPSNPVEIGEYGQGGYPATYVHDSFEHGNRLYLACIYSGLVRVLDTTNPAAPIELNSWTYPGAFTHNLWTDDSGTVLYVSDETQGEPIKVFDVSDVMNPVQVNAFTPNPNAILHNVHVRGDELYVAGYTEGLRVLDITDPRHPAEFASADSYAGPSGGYNGVWETYPYFPSGTVIASDMQTGLYVYRPVRDYGIVRVNVVDVDTQQPVEGVSVYISVLNDSLTTPADGIVQFGPDPGAYTVSSKRFGWTGAAANLNVVNGGRDTLTLAIRQKAPASWSGTLRDAMTLAPLEDADLELRYTLLTATTDVNGDFAFPAVPEDIYALLTHSPGHVPNESNRYIGPGSTGPVTIDVQPAPIYDDLEAPSGWTVGAAGDDATSGIWVRVEPLGTGQPQPGDVQTEYDRTPGAGQMCYVTGQGTTPGSLGEADVDNGRTSLTTPALDLSGMSDPHVGWWQWFYSNGTLDDWFAVRVSNDNGATWTDVDTLRGPDTAPSWKERTIRIADYVTPTAQTMVRFVAADLGGSSVVECAVDDLIAWDAAGTVSIPAGPRAAALRFRAPRPNPAAGAVALTLEVPVRTDLDIAVFDVTGRRVRTLHRGVVPAGPFAVRWDGTDVRGRRAPAGLYFARAEGAGVSAETRVVRVP